MKRKQVFSFYAAPVQTVKSDRMMNVREAYLYITLDQKAMEHTWALREIIKKVGEGKADAGEIGRYKAAHFDIACFSGTFSYRRDDCLVKHSNMLCLDFDHVGGTYEVHRLRDRLVADEGIRTRLAFVSPSGDGLKWVIDIDADGGSHQMWFRAIQKYVMVNYGLKVDEKCGNVSRCCFLPHDGNCYVDPSVMNEPGVCPY